MVEVELKLQVPASALKAVERSLSTPPSVRTRLQAIYFDTPDRRLAPAGIAVRLRKEGRRWVQTLKAGPAHGMARGEHNVELAVRAGEAPVLDLSRHAGTPPGDALNAALAMPEGAPAPQLQAVYATDIWRRHRQQRTRHGVVELALDIGEITATAPDGSASRWPVCELEIELVSGSARAVTERARLLAERHGLWLDVRTKAERGDRLARSVVTPPALKAESLSLDAEMSPREAWAAVLGNTLAHALPNWSEVAGGHASAEHVHQLRVALRRLRSAQRLFEAWPGVPEPTWGDGAAALFQLLGVTRDRDALAGGLQQQIDAALQQDGERPLGAAAAPLAGGSVGAEGAGGSDDGNLRELHRAGLALIDVLAYAFNDLADAPRAVQATEAPSAAQAPADVAPATLAELGTQRLRRWHEQVVKDAKRFDRLEDDERHRLRKRLKRLRYGIEFMSGVLPRRAVERYLKPMREAQESLGRFNDVCVAQAAYRDMAATEPRAWYALGWLAQQRERVLDECRVGLKHLRKAGPFWRR